MKVLEIGPGPGQATIPMPQLGAPVTAVEPGAELAARPVQRVGGGVEVVVSTFESIELPAALRPRRCRRRRSTWSICNLGAGEGGGSLLRDGGWMALWWAIFGDPSRPDPFHEAFVTVLAAKAPANCSTRSPLLTNARTETVRSGADPGLDQFGPIEHDVVRWTGRAHAGASSATCSPRSRAGSCSSRDLREELLDDVEGLAR